MKINKLLIAGMVLPMAAFMSCSDNLNNDSRMPQLDENGMATVSINVSTEGALTRADYNYYDDTFSGTISEGDLIDVLVYEVYQKNSDNTLTPLAYYKTVDGKFTSTGTDIVPDDEDIDVEPDGNGQDAGLDTQDETPDVDATTRADNSFSAGLTSNQSAVKFSKNGKNLVFKVNPETNYLIAFWAQHSGCKAYKLNNPAVTSGDNTHQGGLQALTVDYIGYKNNDESRDAFCGTLEFSGSTTEELTAILHRPFAQINVGTSGADYKASAKIPGGTYYTHSKIKIKGVANTLNIVTDKIGGVMKDESGNTAEIVLDWEIAPAWYGGSIPSSEDEKVKSEGEQFLKVHLHVAGETNENTHPNTSNTPSVGDDKGIKVNQYTRMDLDGDGYFDFRSNYPTVKNAFVKDDEGKDTEELDHKVIERYLTETFKYLSMSYVLVPSTATTAEADPNVDTHPSSDNYKGATLDEVTILFADENGTDQTKEQTAAITSLKLYNIPANRNWRTNIIGGLYDVSDQNKPGDDPENPDDPTPDPEDPDDPTTLFSSVKAKVLIVTDYFDRNNISNIVKYKTPQEDKEEGEGGEDAQ